MLFTWYPDKLMHMLSMVPILMKFGEAVISSVDKCLKMSVFIINDSIMLALMRNNIYNCIRFKS